MSLKIQTKLERGVVLKNLKPRIKFSKNPVRLVFYEKGDKKYLAVVRFNWRGVKWSRHFEIVSEVTSEGRPIEFKANPTIRI